jgi:hypothetical protein
MEWRTLAEARGKVMTERRCNEDEAASELESDLAELRRRARGHRIGTDAGPDAETAGPAIGQPDEEIPRNWWVKAAAASYVSDVIPLYDKNELWSAWKCKYVNVRVSALETHQSHKGGRPVKYDWDLFSAQVIYIANLPDGLPARPELHRQMMDWCAERWGDNAPADSMVRDRLARLLRLTQL